MCGEREGGRANKNARKPILANYILIPSSKLGLSSAQEMGDEVCLTAHMDVVLVGAAAQALV